MATQEDTGAEPVSEGPKFGINDQKQIVTKRSPTSASAENRVYLERYVSKVTILLHTVKDEEMLAACNHLSSPLENGDIDIPIHWFNHDGSISLTLGKFGGYNAAVIQTNKGADCRHSLLPCLQYLSNVKLVIGLGFAYGQRSKSELGDVLISTYIDGVSNFRIEDHRIKFDEGRARYTSASTITANVFTRGTSLWTGFKCSTADRESIAHPGVLISTPMLVNDRSALDDFLKNNERFIGGEMEGQELVQAQVYLRENGKREIDLIVIKGVADFGDGKKEKDWQLTASLAAASYTEYKLLQTGGRVYSIDPIPKAALHRIGRPEDATDVPYFLLIIPSRVEKCYGCNRKFRPRGAVPTPPNDLVVSHREQRSYWDKSGPKQASNPNNAYYHLDINTCIKPRNPSFTLSNLVVSDSDRAKLTDVHKSKLRELGLTVD